MKKETKEYITGAVIGFAIGAIFFGKLVFGAQISEGERDLIAATIEAEAAYEPLEGKIMIAEVILNRTENENFPDTVAGVIQAEGQFSTWENGQIQKVITSPQDYEAVKLALKKEDREPVYFFRNKHYGCGKPWKHVGNHYFSTLSE